MADVLKELNISERMLSPREALSIISRYKNDDISPEQLENDRPDITSTNSALPFTGISEIPV